MQEVFSKFSNLTQIQVSLPLTLHMEDKAHPWHKATPDKFQITAHSKVEALASQLN